MFVDASQLLNIYLFNNLVKVFAHENNIQYLALNKSHLTCWVTRKGFSQIVVVVFFFIVMHPKKTILTIQNNYKLYTNYTTDYYKLYTNNITLLTITK